MPYLALRTNKTLTLSQEVELKTTVGKLITMFPGESVDTFMIHIEDNQLIYFKGQEENCMMITLYLKGHYTDEQKEQFVAELTKALVKITKIPAQISMLLSLNLKNGVTVVSTNKILPSKILFFFA